MEALLTTVLQAQCPRVYPDFAPAGAELPHVTYQGIGGEALRWLNNTAADKRKTSVQISVWSTTRAGTLALIRAIEDALCAATTFTARPQAEPTSLVDQDLTDPLYGSAQDFTIWAAR